ncbi:kelch repeat-containing protein [Brevibacillus laterosporus]|uniref:kelch repeat-containing protein n=1 Tax=Brevibacillus laterosporus TaxID=1465 RepID=UPI004032FBA6
MPTARYSVGGIVYDDKIYVYGGTPGPGSLANLEVYDPEKNEWQTLPSSSLARYGMAFVENQGKFYAMGGGTLTLGILTLLKCLTLFQTNGHQHNPCQNPFIMLTVSL